MLSSVPRSSATAGSLSTNRDSFMINRFTRPAILLTIFSIAALAPWMPLHAQPMRPVPAKRPAKAPPPRPDLVAFGAQLEVAIKDCNPLAISGLLDRDALLDAITQGTKVPEADRTRFFAAAAPALGLGSVICSRIADNGSCRFVGIRYHNGSPRAVFRLVTHASAFDYFEFLLEGKGDNVRFTDVFLLSSGELFSDHVRGAIASDSTVTIYSYLKQHKDVPLAAAMARMYVLSSNGDGAGILRCFDTLSPALRREKPVLLYTVNAAAASDPTRLVELLDSLRSNYPDDPSLDLYLIQHFEQTADYGSELAAVDAIDRREHDSWLNILRAKACMMAGRYDLAKRFADASIAYDSLLIVPRWVLVIVALKDRDFAQAIAQMSFIAAYDNIDAYIAELAKSHVGQEFIASKEYKEWSDARVKL
jgi:hypothetical protein